MARAGCWPSGSWPAPSRRGPWVRPRPKALLVGDQLTDERIAAAAHAVYAVAKPMDNTDFELVWRKKMVTALATCALKELRGDDVSAMRIRMTRIGLWACALMLVLARVAAAAQTSPPTESAVTVPAVSVMLPNYNTVPIGEVASLEAGAFVARADDASAGFYNTAGLARAKRTSISGSAGAFQFGSVSPEGLTNVKGTFQQIPSMFGLVVNNLLGHQTLAGGFSIARVNAWTQAVEVESVRPGMIGSNRFRFSTAAEFDAWQASVGVAYERGDRLRLGASIDGQYTWAARRQSIADQFTTATGLGALTANSIGNLSVSHLRATLASQIEITPSVHLGLVMRTRGLGVTASGSASLEGLARVGGSTVTSSFFDPDASVEYRLPSEFKGGLAWLGKRAQIEADVFGLLREGAVSAGGDREHRDDHHRQRAGHPGSHRAAAVRESGGRFTRRGQRRPWRPLQPVRERHLDAAWWLRDGSFAGRRQ